MRNTPAVGVIVSVRRHSYQTVCVLLQGCVCGVCAFDVRTARHLLQYAHAVGNGSEKCLANNA
jgi:hypothetical protein